MPKMKNSNLVQVHFYFQDNNFNVFAFNQNSFSSLPKRGRSFQYKLMLRSLGPHQLASIYHCAFRLIITITPKTHLLTKATIKKYSGWVARDARHVPFTKAASAPILISTISVCYAQSRVHSGVNPPTLAMS